MGSLHSALLQSISTCHTLLIIHVDVLQMTRVITDESVQTGCMPHLQQVLCAVPGMLEANHKQFSFLKLPACSLHSEAGHLELYFHLSTTSERFTTHPIKTLETVLLQPAYH